MINFRYSIFFVFIFYSFSSFSNNNEKQNIAFRSFWHPMYLGGRLAYCHVDGKKCGKDVADHYCHMLGYAYSTQNEIAYNIGLTHYISTNNRCKGWQCNGFTVISCAIHLSHTPPKPYHYREKRFVDPRFNHYRVDWCYDTHQGCGKRAANSFCNRMGFMQANSFVKETQVSATKTIGSQELCFGNQCNAFKIIVCYR